METKELVFDSAAACAFILEKFREQGDFLAIDGLNLDAMVATAQKAEQAYMEKNDVLDGGVYDDDEAFEAIQSALVVAFPEQKMYAMRFAEDYLDYSEAYLEEAGLIEWE